MNSVFDVFRRSFTSAFATVEMANGALMGDGGDDSMSGIIFGTISQSINQR